jgi:ABC-type amino acid transport substrate-binding protein
MEENEFMTTYLKLSLKILGLAVAITAVSSAQGNSSRLDTVKKRGKLICGVNATLPGFGFLDSNGKYSGFDVDFCKGVAAAVFGDPSKVDFVSLTASPPFKAAKSMSSSATPPTPRAVTGMSAWILVQSTSTTVKA